jgi:amidohydrolase
MKPESHPLQPWLTKIRRDLHMHPEIAFKETRTTARIQEILSSLGVDNRVLPGMETGVVGLIQGKQPGKTLALRADIDALPMAEQNQCDYRSTHEGCMHACGHDAHTTIMLGVAKALKESGLDREIQGQVKLIFQPAEEIVSGAARMIECGVMADPAVDRILTCHMDPEMEAGQAGVFFGTSHAAASKLSLTIKGKGAHGAQPEKGIDPIVAGANFVTTLQSVVSRSIGAMQRGVVTIGSFHAGTARNIIPDRAELLGTIRTLDSETLETIVKRLNQMVEGLQQTFQMGVDWKVENQVPVCVNDPDASRHLWQATAVVLGESNLLDLEPLMGSEDFSLFAQEAPGAVIMLGCANSERGLVNKLHSPHFDLDERVLPLGVEVFLQAIRDYLG